MFRYACFVSCITLVACGSESPLDRAAAPSFESIQQALAAPAAGQGQPTRYIVMLQPGANPNAFAAANGLSPMSVFTDAIRGLELTLPPAAAGALSTNPNVISVTEVLPVTAFAQQRSTGLNRIGGASSADTSGVGVAVLDTGIVEGNSDLNVIDRMDCSSQRKKDKTCVPGGNDVYGHGSHVAGIIGAVDNDEGVLGVVPGVDLYSVKVLDDTGSGTNATIIKGLDWVAQNTDRVQVVNLSLGGPCTSGPWLTLCDTGPCDQTNDPERAAICTLVDAGVTVVVAAGNSSSDSAYYSPAAYPEVITVSAHADFDGSAGGLGSASYGFSSCTENQDDSFACFSNFGAAVDISAPGVGILSWTPGGLEAWSGTSMAAPFVAGASAAYIAGNPGAEPSDVAAALIATAESSACVAQQPGGACADDGDDIPEPLLSAGGCDSDSDCNDGNACTADSCVSGSCSNSAVVCDDGDACTVDSCNPSTGLCQAAPLVCDDGDACNGSEVCDSALGCVAGTPVTCDDGDPCTEDLCNPSNGECSTGADLCSTCLGHGESCNTGSDCCSGNCKRGSCKGN